MAAACRATSGVGRVRMANRHRQRYGCWPTAPPAAFRCISDQAARACQHWTREALDYGINTWAGPGRRARCLGEPGRECDVAIERRKLRARRTRAVELWGVSNRAKRRTSASGGTLELA